MSNFVFHNRFDKKDAVDGKFFEIVDELGNDWGSFKCLLIDGNNPRFKAAAERNARKARAAEKALGNSKNEKLQIKLGLDAAFDTWLVDWELKGANGKPIPYTRENVQAYFGASITDEETGESIFPALWVFLKLSELARDPLHFQPEDQEGLPEKN